MPSGPQSINIPEQTIRCHGGVEDIPQPLKLPITGQYQRVTFEDCNDQEIKLLLVPPNQGAVGNFLWRWAPGEKCDTWKALNLKDPKNFPNPAQKVLLFGLSPSHKSFYLTTAENGHQPQTPPCGFDHLPHVEKIWGQKIPAHRGAYSVALQAPAVESEPLVVKNARGQSVLARLTLHKEAGPLLYIMSQEPFGAGKYLVSGHRVRNFRHGPVYSGVFNLHDPNDFDLQNLEVAIVPNSNDQTFYFTTLRAASTLSQ